MLRKRNFYAFKFDLKINIYLEKKKIKRCAKPLLGKSVKSKLYKNSENTKKLQNYKIMSGSHIKFFYCREQRIEIDFRYLHGSC